MAERSSGMGPRDLTVHQQDCTVWCTPTGGAFKASRGDQVRWRGSGGVAAFTLKFRTVPVDGIPTPRSAWPFSASSSPPVGGASTGPVSEFTGTIGVDEGVFEYDIEVDCGGIVAILDPMIIVRP